VADEKLFSPEQAAGLRDMFKGVVQDFLSPQTAGEVAATVIITKHNSTVLANCADDEPIFVLRASDPLAPYAVMAWLREAEAHGCPPDKCRGADLQATHMISWAQAHGSKLPD